MLMLKLSKPQPPKCKLLKQSLKSNHPMLKPLCWLMLVTVMPLAACQPLDKKDNTASEEPTATEPSKNEPIKLVTLQNHLEWQDCTEHSDWFDGDVPDNLQCTTLTVPVDNAYPKGKTIDLALTKLPATGDYPIGSLLIISGGPGDHSIDSVATSLGDGNAVDEIKANFDIIGFAPRGVAPSTPAIDCGESPSDEETSGEAFVAECVKHSGIEFLKHIDTQNAVLDIERIRMALGEKRLSLIGYSYGTKVLARYLEAYPNSVRAAVLDGVVDVTEDYFTALAGQEKGFQETFERFAKYCTEFEACPFDNAKNYQKGFWAFLNDVDDRKLKDKAGETITGDNVLTIIQDKLFWRSGWDSIIVLMEELSEGKTDTYNELFYEDSDPDEPATEDLGLIAINCADGAPADKKTYLEQAKAIDALSPYNDYQTRDDEYYLDACYYWPNVGTDRTDPPVVSKTLPQVLFVAQKYDPTTPYRNATTMARLFNAPLLTRDGDGHTLVLTDESSCIDDKVASYLKSPTTPIHSETCQ